MLKTRYVTGAAIGLSAFLLFLVEPLVAKELLPLLGGSSAVWLACLCFFQAMLVLGYGYSAVLGRRSMQRSGARVHGALLIVATLLAFLLFLKAPQAHGAVSSHPLVVIFLTLAGRIGLPFLVLSASSPLLQTWFVQLNQGGSPFRLFALSNAGSLLGLFAFPVLLEPNLSLKVQRGLWVAGFAIFSLLSLSLARRVSLRRETTDQPLGDESDGTPGAPRANVRARELALWFLLGVIGSLQLCAVTAHLSANIAAIPLLWVIPLAVYLVSFILAFDAPRWYRREPVLRLLVVMLASLGYLLSKTDVSLPISVAVLFFLLELFLACWFCNAELYRLRPAHLGDLTTFYLVLAAGGASGTIFMAVISPLVFRANYDLPIAFGATAFGAVAITWDEGWSRRALWVTSVVLCAVLGIRLHAAYSRGTIFMARNFYGSLRVKQSDLPEQSDGSRLLLHGTIEHGMQWFAPQFRKKPTTYYGESSGVGLALQSCCGRLPRRIGVIGLGAGTLAAYGRRGDVLRFYEINPLVNDVAKELFTYIRESEATVSIVPGDARQSLEMEPSQRYDVLAVDAFSGDAIPVHLLTLEAIRDYQRHLSPQGLIAFHVSNQYLDLAPIVEATARAAGLLSRVVDSPADADTGIFAARWVLVGRAGAPLMDVAGAPVERAALRPWTDDYSSLLPIVRWSGRSR